MAITQEIQNGPMFQPHVLLVEDEMNVAKGLQMVMNESGYNVDVAMTGEGALRLIKGANYDLLVADLKLPDINGMVVVEEVRERWPDTKVVIITGYPAVASAVQALKMGAADYLQKPFTDDEFKATVSEALHEERSESLEELIAETENERLIQKQEVIKVLDRTSEDIIFWRTLMETGSPALEEYQLSNVAKAAICSGDLQWIRKNVGELTPEQLRFIYRRLEREAW